MNASEEYHQGDVVVYQGRLYRLGSCKLGMIAGPHYRLIPLGDYPDEGLTSVRLFNRPEF